MAVAGEPAGVAARARAEVDDDGVVRDPPPGPHRERGALAGHLVAPVAQDLVPLHEVGADTAHPALDAAYAGAGVDVLERRVGHPPPGAVEEGQHALGIGRCGHLHALEGHRRERDDGLARHDTAAPAELVEDVAHVEGAEDVDVHDAAVGQGQQELEVGRRHPHDLPAQRTHHALHPEGLRDDVGRVRVSAQVGQVGVGVVADHGALADGAEQGAVAEVGVDADLLAEVRDRAGGAERDLPAYVVVGLGEHAAQVTRPVDGQRVPVAVAELEGVGVAREGDLVVVHLVAAGDLQPDPGGAVEVLAQRRGPAHLPAAGRAQPVAAG